MFFLHGILGSGANWRTFARRWVAARPEWGAVLVDLRKHGGSQDFPPPHTLAACAGDLVDLERAVPGPVQGVLGHSFGGKVALAYLARRGEQLAHAFIIDSMPGARSDARGSEQVVKLLDLLEHLPPTFASREDFIARVEAAGFSREIALWQAMNLKREGEVYTLRVDLPAIRALLDDYFAQDFWPVIEAPRSATQVHLIIGGRSTVFNAEDRERAARIAAASGGRVTYDVFPNAGHWVHVDEPEGLLNLVIARTGSDRRTSPVRG